MTLKNYFTTIDLTEIERFLQEKQEENVNLEFKTVNHPIYNDENKNFDKKNISKILSGFANSIGGIVIWGIKAKENSKGQDVAQEKKPIKQLTRFLGYLNKIEGQAVIPSILGVQHEKIEISDDIGFVKTFIPNSDNAPHMALLSDKHYYKRSGDSFYQCEHFDILDMFSRKKYPKLRFHCRQLEKEYNKLEGRSLIKYRFAISIHNDGNNIAKYPYLGLNLINAHTDKFGIDGNGKHGLTKTVKSPIYEHNYIGGNEKVIYPGTMIDIDYFFFEAVLGDRNPKVEIQYLISAENMNNVQDEFNLDEILN